MTPTIQAVRWPYSSSWQSSNALTPQSFAACGDRYYLLASPPGRCLNGVDPRHVCSHHGLYLLEIFRHVRLALAPFRLDLTLPRSRQGVVCVDHTAGIDDTSDMLRGNNAKRVE